MEGLRGHMSGIGIPTYVVDSPHGGGKIPLMPNYLVSHVRRRGGAAELRGDAGPLPGRGQAGDDRPPTTTRGRERAAPGDEDGLIPEGNERMARRQAATGSPEVATAAAEAATAAPASRSRPIIPLPTVRPQRERAARTGEGTTRRRRASCRNESNVPHGQCSLAVLLWLVPRGKARHAHRHRVRPEAGRPRPGRGPRRHPRGVRRARSPSAAIADALRGLGPHGPRSGRRPGVPRSRPRATRRTCVFNFAEGTGVGRTREARVPAVCEMLGIPYTGSDPLALAVALDKDMTRRLADGRRRDRARRGSCCSRRRASTTATSPSSRRCWKTPGCRCR